ncbi:MAG: alkaline phosphatase family protein [Rhodospirillales bacterium]|nr:alkaline phosphatase family protein [Rhodospirillales bacterium]
MTVLMIGLDGATFALLKPLIAQGLMPTLGQLIDNGVHGDLMSTRIPLTPPAWTSMITGRSPEAHGIYDFLWPDFVAGGDGVYLKINDFRDNRCETVWSMANRAGRRATALNFFGMTPPPAIEGHVVSGFVPWKHLRQGTHPKALFETIRGLPGFDYRNLGMDISEEKKCVLGLLDGEHDGWIQLQDTRDTAWTDLACHLMASDRSELTAVVLDGPDKLQHLFWRFVDPDGDPGEDDPWFQRIRSRCLDYYRQLDRNIARLREAAGAGTDIILTSDHGFGPTDEIVYLNEWLARQGYLTWRDQVKADESGQLTANKMTDHLRMIDWRRTVAFCPTPSSNSIFVKRDRGNGNGVREEDYPEFCLTLRRQLLDYRDPANGEPVFIGVDANRLRGVAFQGPCPDLSVRLRDGGFVSILNSPQVVVKRPQRDGTHRPNGIFIGSGPNFKTGAAIAPFSILDIAPLLLHLLQVAIPSDLEGTVPRPALAIDRAVETGLAASAPASEAPNDREPTEEERQALMAQLRILGYMD